MKEANISLRSSGNNSNSNSSSIKNSRSGKSATLIAGAASVAIVAIVGYIIIKKKQIKFKWWFPLAIIVTLWAIMFIVSIVVHYMGWFE